MNLNSWVSVDNQLIKQLPYHQAEWLLEFGSLTEKLERASKTGVELKVIKQSIEKLDTSERMALDADLEIALAREVVLSVDGEDWVFARTLVNQAGEQLIQGLGEKPLGSVLFSGEHLRRHSLQLRKIVSTDGLYQSSLYAKDHQLKDLWARRSLWNNEHLGQDVKILVSEVFLPASPLYK